MTIFQNREWRLRTTELDHLFQIREIQFHNELVAGLRFQLKVREQQG